MLLSFPINENAPFLKPNPIGVVAIVDSSFFVPVSGARTELSAEYGVNVHLGGQSSFGLRSEDSSFVATSSSSENIKIQ